MDAYRPHSPSSEAGSRGQYEGYGQAPYNYDPYSQRPHEEYYGYAPTQGQVGSAAPAHYRNPSGHEYPVSGYAELDEGLIPPNSQEIYRNSPSPALHGGPSDRYDGSFEMAGSLGMHSNDDNTAAVGAEGMLASEGGYAALPEDSRDDREGYYTLRRDEPTYSSNSLKREEPTYHDILRREEALPYGSDIYGIPESEIYGRMRDNFIPNGTGDFDSRAPDGEKRMTPMPKIHNQAKVIPQVPIQTPLSHSSHGAATPNHYGDVYSTNNLRSPSVESTSRVRWRDPDLHEVIDFLSNPNNVVKANAAAYLQHLCYMDDSTKQKTRILGGIPPLVSLLTHDMPDLHRNACGALRNLSYGRQNDENKRAIKDAGGIPSLVRLLHKTQDNEVKELVTGVLWNMSSSEELKQNILDDGLSVLCSRIVIPCSGWGGGEVERDPNNDVWWSIVFKNASGVIRNISSAGQHARTKLRQCPGLVDSLFCVIKLAIQGNSHDNKSVENCVCILRNLSYRCQEVEDPNYDKNQLPVQSRATATDKGDNLGCFGGSRKKREMVGNQLKETGSGIRHTGHRGQPVRGMELLWQPEVVVQPYLALLSDCSNPETLEAAAGAIQNLAACYWQPSVDVRAAVRKDKGLPILVELLRMEVDRVVCAVATALRNLAIDQRNKELIGKYAMRDLVQKLPAANTHDPNTSDETIAAVLATLNEVIKKNAEFSRSLLEAGGVDRLNYITKQRVRYASRVVKFATQVLFSMWSHQELREVYKKSGWKEQDFVSKSVAARSAAGGGAHSPTANNTLNRPMASQSGTRYEDRTIQRSSQPKPHSQYRREEVPLADLGYGGDGTQQGTGRMYQASMQLKPGEPVYAKVNREKKRNRQLDSAGIYGMSEEWVESPPAYTPSHLTSSPNYADPQHYVGAEAAEANNNMLHVAEPAGDSWV